MTEQELKIFYIKGNKKYKIGLLEKNGYKLSDFEKELIMSEDFLLKAYKDTRGIWTVGVGKAYVKPNLEITIEKGLFWLRQSIDYVTNGCKKEIEGFENFEETTKEALLEMAYNMGVEGLKGFPSMLQAIREGNKSKAIIEAVDSKWAWQVKRNRVVRIIRKLGEM